MAASDAFVLLLTGPAGAGKSAAAREWAASRASTTAHIPVDDVRELVVAGFADPREGWTAETQRQYDLARRNCAAMAKNNVAAGVTTVIDDAIFPHWESCDYAGWRAALGETPHYLVALLPDETAVITRNARRHGRRLLAPEMLHVIYEMMEPWRDQRRVPVLDTTNLLIPEVALAIQRAVETLRASGDSG
ncbi:MAG TPA: AAA family ATPase [Ktedonobacterales bacterium]